VRIRSWAAASKQKQHERLPIAGANKAGNFQLFERARSKFCFPSGVADIICRYNQEAPLLTTNLRKVGGSVMLAVPPAVLDMLRLQAGATVALVVDGGRLIVEPQPRRHYTLDELLAQCDPTAEPAQEDREWLDARSAGRELL
jgi:antitoxin ChpS